MYHVPGNVISMTVGLVCINLQPEYKLLSSTRFGQFRKFGKIGVGGTVLPKHPYGNFLHGVRVLVRGCQRVRFDLPSSFNFREAVSPNWGPITLIRSPRGLEWYHWILRI